jgi:hypothetical protein
VARRRSDSSSGGGGGRSGRGRGRRGSAAAIACRIRTAHGDDLEIASSPALERSALAWTYTLGNRTRWNSGDRRLELAERAEATLRELGVSEDAIERLANAGVCEVATPFTSEPEHWAARIMPWEYVLTAATRSRRRGPLTVVRHLERVHGPADPPAVCDRGLAVASAPGLSDELREADTQRRLLELGLFRGHEDAVRGVRNPSLSEFAAAVREQCPSIIHVAGVDTYGGAGRLGRILLDPSMPPADRGGAPPAVTGLGAAAKDRDPFTGHGTDHGPAIAWSADEEVAAATGATMEGRDGPSVGGRRDGLMLTTAAGDPVAVPAHAIALACTAGAPAPALVVFNVPRSAARTAALTVAAGAGLALGIQDSAPRAFVDRFLAEFYGAWQESQHDALVAFQLAWQNSRDAIGEANLTGTGIVLWSGRPLVHAGADLQALAGDVGRRLSDRRTVRTDYVDPAEARERLLGPDAIVPLPRLNYALLHNRQPMFERFELVHDGEGTVEDVLVEVDLVAGPERLPWRRRLSVGPTPISLAESIFVPLTSELTRSVDERVQASVTVRISLPGPGVILEETHRVTLLPVAEWADTETDRHWLPSFVYPMDPAVRRIVDLAQPYLEAIADDPLAGFDGYQAIDPRAEEPARRVDQQVAAIWSAIRQDTPLAYINPPPVYTDASQRLRTPSETIEGRRGTCLDLALLFAACLEYVDIHPVLFLMRGHAFPGWWRTDVDRDRFFAMDDVGELAPDALAGYTDAGGRRSTPGWFVPAARHAEVRDQAAAARLVPIETVWLTVNGGFADAMDEGWENLLAAAEFDGMVDVIAARQALPPVTPLPRRGAPT